MEEPVTVRVIRISALTIVSDDEGARLLPGAPSPTLTHSTIHLASDDGTINLRMTQRDPADYPPGTVFSIALTQSA